MNTELNTSRKVLPLNIFDRQLTKISSYFSSKIASIQNSLHDLKIKSYNREGDRKQQKKYEKLWSLMVKVYKLHAINKINSKIGNIYSACPEGIAKEKKYLIMLKAQDKVLSNWLDKISVRTPICERTKQQNIKEVLSAELNAVNLDIIAQSKRIKYLEMTVTQPTISHSVSSSPSEIMGNLLQEINNPKLGAHIASSASLSANE